MCVTNSAFSLRKPWANSKRDSIVPLSSFMCYSVPGIFKIPIFIMRGGKKASFILKKISVPLWNLPGNDLKTNVNTCCMYIGKEWELWDNTLTLNCNTGDFHNIKPHLFSFSNTHLMDSIYIKHLTADFLLLVEGSAIPSLDSNWLDTNEGFTGDDADM